MYSKDLLLKEGISDVGPDRLKDHPIRKHNNVQQWGGDNSYLNYSVGIDRVLDHHLLVYVEYQTLESPELGSEVGRGRQLILIPKGETFIYCPIIPPDYTYQSYNKISVRVLPYTDMDDIKLPVKVDNLDSDDGFSLKDITVVAGHTFRPYRIASSSFFMQLAIPTESNW